MKITAIVACGENGAIGLNNQLLWHLPNDLKHFKQKTLGKPIIMGRKTWESIGGRPLPKRTNIVVSRNPQWSADGAVAATSLDQALERAAGAEEVVICGGAQLYALAMPRVETLEITVVHAELSADTFFPAWNKTAFELTAQSHHPADDRHPYAYTFETWNRKKT